jgi:ribosome-associated heat shock protein Hsp15
MTPPPERARVDKWLWAARFFKTRGLATEAIQGGRVKVNEVRAKPAKEVRAGDQVEVRVGELTWVVVVEGIREKRGSAAQAAMLYTETSESRERRELFVAQRRLAPVPGVDGRGRPTKRDRRRIELLRGRDLG